MDDRCSRFWLGLYGLLGGSTNLEGMEVDDLRGLVSDLEKTIILSVFVLKKSSVG